ncbi:kinase-like domain-containing protein [Rhizophagus irregularis DAOM 181602=DAOM 197198]|nr:kinase-like domain-containing protein [Rhizophagus irregularis DAOM 181602=DAOM 197198]
MSITLFCLVKGNTTANAFPVHIDKGQFVGDLKDAIKEKIDVPANFKAKDLKLWKKEIPDDQDDLLSNLILNDEPELLATREIGDYWTEKPPKRNIHVIVKLPLLSLEEALSCIPPPITYSPKCTLSKSTTKVSGIPPTSVKLWGDFFEEVNQFLFDQQPRFERPKFNDGFVVVKEEVVRNAINVNICMILNKLTGPDYDYSMRQTEATGEPDFTCHYLVDSLILVIEAKRKHVLEDMGEQTFPEFYQTSNLAKDVIQQIWNYMGENELRYGILATYDNHWFLRREHTELWISKTLPLQSESPPVLKAYAYLTRQAKENTKSPHPQVLVPVHGDNNSRVLRSHMKSPSSSSISQQPTSSNQQLSSSTPVDQKNYSFTDFKFKGILGEGRSGKTLLCEFRGNAIALKSVDLSKAPPYVLEEMQKEVEIYKDLTDIQGKWIYCTFRKEGGANFQVTARIEELEKNKEDSSAENVRRDVEIAEIKAEVVKLRDNNEESKQLTSRQSEVTSKEMISGYDQNTIDEIEPQSSVSSNTINLVSNVYEKEDVSDHTLAPSAKSSEEKETDAFLNEVDKKMISDRIRQRNREKKLQRKNEQGLIQEINSSMKEKHILSAVTEISANQVRPNSLAEKNEERAVHPDIISLYETACGAEKKAIEANREETLRWCFYAREFKRMYKDFMVSNKVGEKKAKGQVYDFIIKQLPDTKRKTLCRQTQKALRIDDLFEKIGMDKLQYIKTYSADTISKFTDPQIQIIIDHFTEKPNMEFIDDTEDVEQDNEVLEEPDQNNVLEILPPKESTAPQSTNEEVVSQSVETDDDSNCSHDNDSEEEMPDESDDDGYDGYGGYNEYVLIMVIERNEYGNRHDLRALDADKRN